MRVIGVFDDRGDDRSAAACNGVPKLGTVDDLVEFARHTRVDLVIFSLPISAEGRILQMLKKLWVLPVDIRLAAHTNKLRFRPRSYSYIGNVPVLDIFDRPIADWDVVMKWLFDKIVGIAGADLRRADHAADRARHQARQQGAGLLQAAALRLQQRTRRDLQVPLDVCRKTPTPTASKLVTRNDPRVTRVGRFIRKTSLDELPQLFNVVFTGNLSLVGPRPHAIHAKAAEHLYDEAVDGYFARHRVKPGITGWAQINGWRGETDSREKIQRRVEHDLYYIENWSILFDLYIVLRTPFALHSRRRRVLRRVSCSANLTGCSAGRPCSRSPRVSTQSARCCRIRSRTAAIVSGSVRSGMHSPPAAPFAAFMAAQRPASARNPMPDMSEKHSSSLTCGRYRRARSSDIRDRSRRHTNDPAKSSDQWWSMYGHRSLPSGSAPCALADTAAARTRRSTPPARPDIAD